MSQELIPNSPNNLPQIFDFHGHKVRIIIINNEPWWVASDVCKVLDLKQVSVVMHRIDTEDGMLISITHPQSINKTIDVNCVNESGLYELIFCSNKLEAKKFKKWITSEVLPSIRKTGKYEKKDSYIIEDPIERAKRWIEEKQETIKLQKENEHKQLIIEKQEDEIEFLEKEVNENKEKAECADRFLDFENIGYDMNEAAQILDLPLGGRNKLMERLREDNIFMKTVVDVSYEEGKKVIHTKNIPYRNFVRDGYFIIRTSREPDKNNVIPIYTKTRVTTKGLEFLRKRYGNN